MTAAKTIHIHYYAVLREQRGVSQEQLQTVATNAKELYFQLQKAHPLRLSIDQLRLAVNNEFVDWNTPLQDGDTVVFIPPVAGG